MTDFTPGEFIRDPRDERWDDVLEPLDEAAAASETLGQRQARIIESGAAVVLPRSALGAQYGKAKAEAIRTNKPIFVPLENGDKFAEESFGVGAEPSEFSKAFANEETGEFDYLAYKQARLEQDAEARRLRGA